MKLHSLLFALLFLSFLLIPQNNQAQSLTEIEYFFDYNDPGVGNATSIVLDPVPEIDMMVSFDANALPVGIHTLCVRIKDSDNKWSHLNTNPFFKLDGFDQANITELSYWFEGVNNNATSSIPITATAALDATFDLDVSDMEPGIYTLYVSAKNGFGQTSILHRKAVQVFSGENDALSIRSLEYFWNDDPGVGNGTNISLNEAELDSSFILNIPQTTELQIDYLSLRVQDQAGKWSLTDTYPINNCPTPVPVTGFETICTGNIISFIDQSKNADEILWDFGDGTTATIGNPLHEFTPGLYEVNQYITNECGTEVETKEIEIFGIESFTPDNGGQGDIFMDFYGWGFDETTKVSLILDGVKYEESWGDYTELKNVYRALIDMHEAPLGIYDVELITTNETYYYENAFAIEETKFDFRVEVMGPSAMRVGVENPHSFRVHNDGNRRAGTVALYIFVPDSTVLTPLDSIINIEDLMTEEFDTLKEYVEVGPDTGYPVEGRLYGYMIYNIPAYSYGDFRVNLNFPNTGNTDIKAWVKGPYSGSGWLGYSADCWRAKANLYWTYLNIGVSLIPGFDCPGTIALQIIGAVGTAVSNGVFGADGWAQSKQGAGLVKSVAAMLKDCSGELAFVGTAGTSMLLETAADIIFAEEALVSALLLEKEACKPEEKETKKEKKVRVLTSFDPNMKTGPSGYAAANFISDTEKWLDYSIFFENLDSATLPAQVVTILDTLDKSVFDLSTFTLKSFGIAEKIANIPPGRSEYVHLINLPDGLQLRASFKLDTASAIFRTDLMTIDPSTGDLTADPLAGFLPPNVSHPEGQGHVSYSIKMKEGLPNFTTIANKASIIFDNNDAIETDLWFNVLDTEAPTSMVTSSNEINDSTIVVELESNDSGGSGVSGYEVYVNVNTGGWINLGEYNSPFTFTGENDLLYEFYFQAVDSVGNEELKLEVAEVSFQIGTFNAIEEIPSSERWTLYPNPAYDKIIVAFTDEDLNVESYTVFDVNGKLVYQGKVDAFSNGLNIDVKHFANGFYHLELELKDGKALRKYFMKQ